MFSSGASSPTSSAGSKRMFTKAEDEKLVQLVKKFGINDWERIIRHMPNRNARQCKERWTYYLDPKINNTMYSIEEDVRLLNKVKEYGKKWTTIASLFDNRTPYSLKNRYQYLQRSLNRVGCTVSVEEIHDMPPPKPKPRPREKHSIKEIMKVQIQKEEPKVEFPSKAQEYNQEEQTYEEDVYMSPQTDYTYFDEADDFNTPF